MKIKLLASAVLLASTVAFGSVAQEQPIIDKVDVSMDMSAIKNADAAKYWSHAADDVKGEIIAGLVGHMGKEGDTQGATVTVDLNALELANSYQAAVGSAQSQISGKVNVASRNGKVKSEAYDLTVTMKDATPYFGEGVDVATVTTDSPVYYQAMVKAFAETIVKKLSM